MPKTAAVPKKGTLAPKEAATRETLAPVDGAFSAAAANREAIMSGLAGTIDAPRLPITYRLNLLVVAGAMLLLPAIYVALIALVAWATWWHATHDQNLLTMIGDAAPRGSGRGAAVVAIALITAYVGPILIGALLVAFMVKPLFQRRKHGEDTLVLKRAEQPTLFEFVDRLARHIGAPGPRQIEVDCDVNASARFRRGLVSSLSGEGDLVLRIGLPLVSNLPLKNFAGILAHEFGHFAQRGGMTLTYVIRTISHWFGRVVYERDSWDEWLENVARHGEFWPILIVANLARAFVWLSRRVLWCLMMVGHMLASLMLRQMEYDADRYETLLVGTKEFERTARALKSIGLATQWAYDAVGSAWSERRLPDDLPALIVQQHAGMTPQVLTKLSELVDGSKTGWLDTHPSDKDRIAAARRLNSKGTLSLDLPAAALFTDYAELSRRATLARYFEVLGPQVKPENLKPVEQVIRHEEEKADHFRSLARYTQGVIHPVALAAPRTVPVVSDLDEATMRVLELRNALMDAAPAAREAMKQLGDAQDKRRRVGQVKALQLAGLTKIPAKPFGFKRADATELAEESKQADALTRANKPTVQAAQGVAIERLALALGLEPLTTHVPPPKKPAAEAETYDVADDYDLAPTVAPSETLSFVRTMAALDGARGTVQTIGDEHGRLHVLLACLKPQDNAESLVGAILSRGKTLAEALTQLRDALPTTPYPYDHAVAGITVRGFVMGDGGIPARERPIELFEMAGAAHGRFIDLYGRVLSDLVHRAEAVETHLGLSPLATWDEQESAATTTGGGAKA